jgi:hypothetical protein
LSGRSRLGEDAVSGVAASLDGLANGSTFVRQGKGDHEIWQSPINGRRFMVDNKIKSRKWANIKLKNAGIPKAL